MEMVKLLDLEAERQTTEAYDVKRQRQLQAGGGSVDLGSVSSVFGTPPAAPDLAN